MLVYLDSTALSRLAGQDGSADALILYLGRNPALVSCRVAEATLGAHPLLAAVALREVDSSLLQAVAQLPRSSETDLTAGLHLAAALELRRELEGFVTYDERIATAARALRLPVVTPS